MSRRRPRGPESGQPFDVTPDEAQAFWARVRKTDGCWLWEGPLFQGGYGQVRIQSFSRVSLRAHRVAYRIAIGPIPPGVCVLHKCDNPPCVKPGHLALGSHRDNMREMVERGRTPKVRPYLRKAVCVRGHVIAEVGRKGSRCCGCIRENDERERGDRFRALAARLSYVRDEVLCAYLPSSRDALATLMSARDAEVLCSYFALYESQHESMSSIGRRLGVSRERARQLRRRALNLLDVPHPDTVVDLVHKPWNFPAPTEAPSMVGRDNTASDVARSA
jgi:hypothetical protein